MSKPIQKTFLCTSKSDVFFTNGVNYTAFDLGNGRYSFIDNEDDNHGMSAAQVKRWFKQVIQ